MPADSSTHPSLRRKWGFTLGAIVAGLAVLAWITVGIQKGIRSELAVIQAAGEPMDATSLDAWVGHLPESENGAIRVLELVDDFRGVDNTQVPRRARSWDATKLAWASTERARVQSWRIDMHTALQAREFRYPLVVTNGLASEHAPHLFSLKSAAATLAFWATHSAAIHQPDESATALLDGLRLARSLDDEPILISWLLRVAYLTIMSIGTENALTLGPLPEARLAELQAAFLDADRPVTLTRALISERALGFEGCQSSPSEYVKLTLAPPGTPFGTPRREWIAATAAQTAYRLSGGQGADSEYYLKTLRELIEITRLTGPARSNALLILQNRFTLESAHWNRHRSRTFAESLFEAVKKDQRIATLLRSAAVACAIERFRAAHQDRLPNSLADLVPTYLAALPLDPYDNRPLRFRTLNPGYVVYGIGPDGEDNQGNSVRKLGAGDTGLDIPFTVER